MNREKIIDGLTALLHFTNALADQRINHATFKAADMMITPANEKQILAAARKQAEEFARARNAKASPRSNIGDDPALVQQVKQWVANRGKRFRG